MSEAQTRASLQIVSVTPTYRRIKRPFRRVPDGVRIRVRGSQGLTSADVHRMVQSRAFNAAEALNLPGTSFEVRRAGADYSIVLSSQSEGTARELQRRAAQMTRP